MLKLIKHILTDKLSLAWAILLTILVLYLSLMPTDNLPSLEVGQVDKLYHLIAYTFLSSSWFLYFIFFKDEQKTKRLALVISSLILFGIIIEVLQSNLTDYRTFDWWDVVSNTIGIFIAFILFRTNKNKLRKLKLQLNV